MVMIKKLIIGLITGVCGALFAFSLPNMSPKQTSEEIRAQKEFADKNVIPEAPEDSKTPLKLFESYFAGLARVDASEFDYFTKQGIVLLFDDPTELTAEDRKNIAEGAKELGERGHKLEGFWYHADAEKPSIVFAYMYAENGETSEPVWSYEKVKLDLVKTEKGWRIDRYTELGGW